MKITAICWFKSLFVAALFLCSGVLCAQKQHRYVLAVETTSQVQLDKKKSPADKSKTKRPKKSVAYYEIISAKPLTLKQCQDLIKKGKTKRIRAPKREISDLLSRKNMTLEGETDVNIWDVEPTEYDLMHEDPDLYDFIAD